MRTLVILTRNEIEGLNGLFSRIPMNAADEVLAIDYKSTDGSKEFLAEKNWIRLINQEKSGRGEAMRLAADSAKGDIICFFSPDGNEDPSDIPNLFGKIGEGYDLAVASRFMKGSRNEEDDKFLKLRSFANQAFSFLANLFFKGQMTDTINGFRAIKKEVFKKLTLDAEGYAIEYQMSIRAMKAGLKIGEIPTFEGNRIGGRSKAKSIPVGLKVLRILIKEIFNGK